MGFRVGVAVPIEDTPKNESIWGWENNRSKPGIEYMPAIIEFLGYNPLATADTWAERLVAHRTALGLTQKEAAGAIGVDPGTLARWERGERELAGRYLERAGRFLNGGQAGLHCGRVMPVKPNIGVTVVGNTATDRCRKPP